MDSIDRDPGTKAASDKGWTTPWLLAGGSAEDCVTQCDIRLHGDMALMTMATCAIERYFPGISSGILTLELVIRSEHPTVTIDAPDSSVLKVYATDADQAGGWAFRWHHPYAWPEVGGNTFPRFYVIDGRGRKRKGLEYTDMRVEAGIWYKVGAVLNLDTQTWQFWVDGVQFDALGVLGHEMTWWKNLRSLSKVRIQSIYSGKNWIDAVAIRHNGEFLAGSSFEKADGYRPDETIIGLPAPPSASGQAVQNGEQSR